MRPERFDVFEYEDARGRSEIRQWRKRLKKSNPKASAKVDWLIELLETMGTSLGYPYVSHIRGPIYELRGKGRDAVRVYYWQQDERSFVMAAGETKQQKKANPRLVQSALDAYAEYNEE